MVLEGAVHTLHGMHGVIWQVCAWVHAREVLLLWVGEGIEKGGAAALQQVVCECSHEVGVEGVREGQHRV